MPTIPTQTDFWVDVELPSKLAKLAYDPILGIFRQIEVAFFKPIDPDECKWGDLQDAQCDEAWLCAQSEYDFGPSKTFTHEFYGNPYISGSGPW